jgi:cyclin-dependent kinase regulatory subunit CKS1
MDNGADMDIDFTRRNKKPRPLNDSEKNKLDEFIDAIHYSARYAPESVHILRLAC